MEITTEHIIHAVIFALVYIWGRYNGSEAAKKKYRGW